MLTRFIPAVIRLTRMGAISNARLLVRTESVGGHLYAFDDLCTCSGRSCPPSRGLLTETMIMCQCHGPKFDITTGAVIGGPASRPLNVYEVQVVDGSIRIPV
jgi:3-phenylpropionate/trans-cinnamate dioxygenase ferredoxin subunit